MKREQVLPHVMADMAARIAKGADQYGEPLTTFNGRDALQDAYEEALDLALYLKQAIMEREASTYPVVLCGKENLKVQCHIWPGPDWSQAPIIATSWAMDMDGECWWHLHEIGHQEPPDPRIQKDGWVNDSFAYVHAPSFGYTGDWRDSLRKRPA